MDEDDSGAVVMSTHWHDATLSDVILIDAHGRRACVSVTLKRCLCHVGVVAVVVGNVGSQWVSALAHDPPDDGGNGCDGVGVGVHGVAPFMKRTIRFMCSE